MDVTESLKPDEMVSSVSEEDMVSAEESFDSSKKPEVTVLFEIFFLYFLFLLER